MRLLGLLFVLIFSATVWADDTQKFTVKAQARTRFETDDFTNYSSSRTMTLFRFRPQLLWEANPNTHFVFEPQFARTFGDTVTSSNSSTGTPEQTSGVTADPSLGVHQAYLDYRFTDHVKVLAGRQILSFGDELVVGALEWNNVARSFDTLRVQVARDKAYQFDYFWAKLVESNSSGSGTGDYDFMGANHSWKPDGVLNEIDAYLFYLKDTRGVSVDPLKLATTGVRAKVKSNALDSRVEITQQFGRVNGSRDGSHGTQADLEVGYTFDSSKSSRAGIEGFYADKEYNQLFPTVHKWLGIADVFGRRNIMGGRVFYGSQLSEALKVSTDFHLFYKTDASLPAYKTSGAALTGSTSSEKKLGYEWDLVGTYQLDDKNSLQLGSGVFFAASSMRQIHSGNPIFAYAAWETRF